MTYTHNFLLPLPPPVQIARSGAFINFREVSARLLLPPGRYCIVPSTYEADRSGDYMVRVLEERDWGVLRQPVIENHAVQVRNVDFRFGKS